jgi:lysine 2,3-aminomutase
LPEYVLDIPGGHGKAPIGPEWTALDETGMTVTDFKGETHHYGS